MAEVLGRYLAAGDVEHATFTDLVLSLSLLSFGLCLAFVWVVLF
jgi:hypothetical protein